MLIGTQTGPQGVGQLRRQQTAQVGGGHAAVVGRFHAADVQLAFALQKAPDVLGRGGVRPGRTACRVGLCFQLPLERDGLPGVVCKVGAVHAHHHGGVCIFAAAGVVAHAVGHHTAFLTGRGHHLPTGAHAEGIHAPLPHMLGQLVFAAGQGRVACRLVIQALFDLALQMLCAEAHAEGLALQHKAAVHEHGKGIAG